MDVLMPTKPDTFFVFPTIAPPSLLNLNTGFPSNADCCDVTAPKEKTFGIEKTGTGILSDVRPIDGIVCCIFSELA